jgi:hypothetical protein
MKSLSDEIQAAFDSHSPETFSARSHAALLAAVGALETLRVAVNDKQPDPGAVMFIDTKLARIRGMLEGKEPKV